MSDGDGYAVYVADCRAKLAPGAEEPDYEDEWDDMTLAQKEPYMVRAAASAAGPAPAPAAPAPQPMPPSPKPAPKPAPPPKPATPAPTPPAKPSASKASSAAGPSSSKQPGSPAKRDKAGGPRKPRTAFELFSAQQRRADSLRNDDDDDGPPDLGQVPEARLRQIIVELGDGADPDEYETRGELLAYCAQLFSVAGPVKWRKAEQRLERREQWRQLSAEEQQGFEREAAREREAYEKLKLESDKAKAPANPEGAAAAKPQSGVKRKAPADADVKIWEETCPEFGDGWTRRSRQRAGSAHVDHTYLSPDGKAFNSRTKVVQHLGLPGDPGGKGAPAGRRLSDEEREERERAKQQKLLEKQALRDSDKLQKQKQREKEKEKAKTKKEQEKGAKGQAKERLASAARAGKEKEEERLKAAQGADGPTGPPAPEPPGSLPLKDASLSHDVMAVWAFACSFHDTLALTPFSPEMLCAALQRPGESVLLAELHVRLLRTLLHEFESMRKHQLPAPLDAAMLLQQVPPPSAVSQANWAELLRNVGAVLPHLFTSKQRGSAHDACAEGLRRLHGEDYLHLSIEHKLGMLRALMDAVNGGELLHAKTTDNEKAQRELVQQRKAFEEGLKKELAAARKAREAEAKKADAAQPAAPPGGAKGAPPKTPVEAARRKMATAALLEAIRERDEETLQEAVNDAVGCGHSGELPDGRPWATDELKAGRRLLLEFEEAALRREEDERLGKKLAKQLRKHVEKMGLTSMREEPLGEDRRGRRFWFFHSDSARLWVEAPKGQTVERESGAPWAWAFYDTAAHVAALVDSLDGRGQGAEARLKRGLRELQPVFSGTMTAQQVTNEDDGWLETGHAWIGQAVLRTFPNVGASTGRITRYLPADEEAGEGALFHVVHDADGDREDLEEDEAREAIEAYAAQLEAGGGDAELEQPKYANMMEQKRLRVAPHHLGVLGLRDGLLELEEQLAEGLRRHHSKWDSREGGRELWLHSCRNSESVVELTQLLRSLEATVRKLQKADDIAERPAWRTDPSAHEYIGAYARRFFQGFGASDGKIVGYLPPEGADGALWHMVHGDDKDEEDLDEQEVAFALANYRDDLKQMSAEEREHNEQYQAKQAAADEEPAEEEDDDEDEDDDPMDIDKDDGGGDCASHALGAHAHPPPRSSRPVAPAGPWPHGPSARAPQGSRRTGPGGGPRVAGRPRRHRAKDRARTAARPRRRASSLGCGTAGRGASGGWRRCSRCARSRRSSWRSRSSSSTAKALASTPRPRGALACTEAPPPPHTPCGVQAALSCTPTAPRHSPRVLAVCTAQAPAPEARRNGPGRALLLPLWRLWRREEEARRQKEVSWPLGTGARARGARWDALA